MIAINAKADISQVRAGLALLSQQGRVAFAKAMNDTAFYARKKIQDEMGRVFDAPTAWTKNSVYVRMARPDNLRAEVEPTYMGGKGNDPQNTLRAQIFGGERKLKRHERALASAGILQPGYYAVMPSDAMPGQTDGSGNYKASFYVQLLSYFAAFGEQGYRANMTSKRRGSLARYSKAGYKSIGGVVYFVSWGKLRGDSAGALPYGIWAKTGTHGANVRPVLLFVRKPQYRQRLDFHGIGERVITEKFPGNFDYRMKEIGL